MLWIKVLPLLGCSIWMACNLRYEKRPEQRRKNARIELLYCLAQAAVAVSAYLSRLYFTAPWAFWGSAWPMFSGSIPDIWTGC